MIIKSIAVGAYQENCYFLIDETTNECVIVDPGAQADYILAVIKQLNITPKYILLTHAHFDHVGAIEELTEHFKVPFYVNKNDYDMQQIDNQLFSTTPVPNGFIQDGDTFKLGNNVIKAITTPGHTPGGVCFLVNDMLITGDTLFNGSIGRTDFTAGDFNTLISSIKDKLLNLGDNIKVYPGHGESTTIGMEKKQNPYILGDNYVY
ncbi:MAG: MBL fold metallo-hydrolase [Sarcina sp.]